jgi:hypothetical protein
MELLDPLEVDDWDNADLEVGILRNVYLLRHDSAVQALIEQKIGLFRQRSPFRKGARRCPV